MSNLAYKALENDIQTQVDQLRTKLTSIAEAQSGQEAQPLIVEASSIYKRVNQQLRELEREKALQDFNVKSALDRKIRNYTRQLNELNTTLNQYRTKLNENSADAAVLADMKMQRQVLLESRVIGEDSQASLLRTKQTILESQNIGTETVITLEQQTEQMQRMNDDISTMQNVSQKSKKVLRRLQNQVVTSKLMSFFIILMEIVILALIVYFKYYS